MHEAAPAAPVAASRAWRPRRARDVGGVAGPLVLSPEILEAARRQLGVALRNLKPPSRGRRSKQVKKPVHKWVAASRQGHLGIDPGAVVPDVLPESAVRKAHRFVANGTPMVSRAMPVVPRLVVSAPLSTVAITVNIDL